MSRPDLKRPEASAMSVAVAVTLGLLAFNLTASPVKAWVGLVFLTLLLSGPYYLLVKARDASAMVWRAAMVVLLFGSGLIVYLIGVGSTGAIASSAILAVQYVIAIIVLATALDRRSQRYPD